MASPLDSEDDVSMSRAYQLDCVQALVISND